MKFPFFAITDYTKGDSGNGGSGDSGESIGNERLKMSEWLVVGFTSDRDIHRNEPVPNRSW